MKIFDSQGKKEILKVINEHGKQADLDNNQVRLLEMKRKKGVIKIPIEIKTFWLKS